MSYISLTLSEADLLATGSVEVVQSATSIPDGNWELADTYLRTELHSVLHDQMGADLFYGIDNAPVADVLGHLKAIAPNLTLTDAEHLSILIDMIERFHHLPSARVHISL